MSENIISKKDHMNYTFAAGLSELEGQVPPDQLTLSQTEGGGVDYAMHTTLLCAPPGFSDLPTALQRKLGVDDDLL